MEGQSRTGRRGVKNGRTDKGDSRLVVLNSMAKLLDIEPREKHYCSTE